jgi:hypothetical protein
VIKCDPSFNQYRYSLADGKQRFVMYGATPFEEESVVRVRGIARVEWGDEPVLHPNDYTWVMKVPEWMSSFREGGVVTL